MDPFSRSAPLVSPAPVPTGWVPDRQRRPTRWVSIQRGRGRGSGPSRPSSTLRPFGPVLTALSDPGQGDPENITQVDSGFGAGAQAGKRSRITTPRRYNTAPSQHRDVTTPRRHNTAPSQDPGRVDVERAQRMGRRVRVETAVD